MKSNQPATNKLADLFRPHMDILSVDAETVAAGLLAKDPPLSLEELQEELQGYEDHADAVRRMCANHVRTGVYTCDPVPRCSAALSSGPALAARAPPFSWFSGARAPLLLV